MSKLHRMTISAPTPCQNTNFFSTSTKVTKNSVETFRVVCSFRSKLKLVSHILYLIVWRESFVLKVFPVWSWMVFRNIKRILAQVSLFLTKLVVNKKIKSKRIFLKRSSLLIFWDFSMFYQILISPQVNRSEIFTYQQGR